jgi:photosystem II stability/assembly factor-like uncharacterized protein
LCALPPGSPTFAADEREPRLIIAETPLRVDRTLVLGAARGGQRVVAVGERGAIFLSENAGTDWTSHRSVTTRTLTSVVSLDDGTWIGAGHGGALLRSEEGGKSARLIETEAGKDSFLGLTALSATSVLAYGAFGLMLRSDDAGRTWRRQQIIEEGFDRHITRVVAANGMLLLVGESGTLAKSTDGGASWTRLASPYEGSYFGAAVTPGGALLIFGMRGNLYRSADGGTTWEKIDLPTKLPFFGALARGDNSIVLTGGMGWLAVSNDDGRSFRLKRAASRSIAGAFARTDGTLVAYGEQGIRTLPANALKD